MLGILNFTSEQQANDLKMKIKFLKENNGQSTINTPPTNFHPYQQSRQETNNASDVEVHKNGKSSRDLCIAHANRHKHGLALLFQLASAVVEENQLHDRRAVGVAQICIDSLCDLGLDGGG